MNYFTISDQHMEDYKRNGFIIVNRFLTDEETRKLADIALNDTAVRKYAIDLNDQSGKKTRLTQWYTPGNDAYGILTKSKRMVESVNRLMDGNSEVCHYHSKLMQKEPRVGGAWEWHQDYGYWYKNEFLFPDQMISVMVAITDANKENGCLQVISGSHKMGRIEHGFSGEQVGASQHYVDLALNRMEKIYVELKAGDALFFHPNLLHRSEANLSEHPRWSLIACYNRKDNVPANEPSTASTVPLAMVPDESIMQTSSRGLVESADFGGKEQIHKENA